MHALNIVLGMSFDIKLPIAVPSVRLLQRSTTTLDSILENSDSNPGLNSATSLFYNTDTVPVLSFSQLNLQLLSSFWNGFIRWVRPKEGVASVEKNKINEITSESM